MNAIGRLEILQIVHRNLPQKSKNFLSPNIHSQEKWFKKIKIPEFLEKHPCRMFWISYIWNLKAIGRLEILQIVHRKLPRKSKIFPSPNSDWSIISDNMKTDLLILSKLVSKSNLCRINFKNNLSVLTIWESCSAMFFRNLSNSFNNFMDSWISREFRWTEIARLCSSLTKELMWSFTESFTWSKCSWLVNPKAHSTTFPIPWNGFTSSLLVLLENCENLNCSNVDWIWASWALDVLTMVSINFWVSYVMETFS